jgi:UDP-N-acetyl-D-mannosaminuronic acid dehydrogenase
MFNKISVIGLGYIGLPTAAVFASRKVKVVGVDVNQATVDTINRGEIHIVEPHLDMLVHAAVTEGFLIATDTPEPADAFIVAVPTPIDKDNFPDLSYLDAAIRSISPVLKIGNLVIIESTLPVGTTERMAELLKTLRPDLSFPQDDGDSADIKIAHCPERVLPGQVVRELVENDRLIGGISESCSQAAADLYGLFVEGECIFAPVRTAEMAKLAENSFRDVNIAYANELSLICDSHGINVWELISLANRHPRVEILEPGAGVGGHCIAVDPWFLVSQNPDQSKLIRSAREVNDSKPVWVVDKIRSLVKQQAQSDASRPVNIACLGVTFKPNIDDIRESPAMQIVSELCTEFPGQVIVVEPNLAELPDSISSARKLDLSDAIEFAEIVVVLVSHREFSGIRRKTKDGQTLFMATKV